MNTLPKMGPYYNIPVEGMISGKNVGTFLYWSLFHFFQVLWEMFLEI